jgi:chromosome segregation ATPase
MKTASLLLAAVFAICLIGCENPELITCQDEKAALTSQLDQAKATIAEKDNKIEALKIKNTEDQTTAMEAVTTMMQKQAEQDKQIKDKLAEKTQKCKEFEMKVASLETEIQNQKGLYENMKKTLQTVEQEKQALMKKIEEIQKAAVVP